MVALDWNADSRLAASRRLIVKIGSALLVDELSAFKARIDAMHQAALSAEAVHRLVARVEASKPRLSVRLSPLGAEDQPLAWAVTAVQRG